MTPLEAARRLAEGEDPLGLMPDKWADGDREYCYWCKTEKLRWDSAVFTHADDCPWLAMPQIVAALEAAQTLIDGAGIECVDPEALKALESAIKGESA